MEVFRQSLESGTCVMVTVTGVDVRNAQKDEASSAAAAKPEHSRGEDENQLPARLRSLRYPHR